MLGKCVWSGSLLWAGWQWVVCFRPQGESSEIFCQVEDAHPADSAVPLVQMHLTPVLGVSRDRRQLNVADREVVVCSCDGLPYSSQLLEMVSCLMRIFTVQSQECGEQCIAGQHLLKSWERSNFFI